MKDESENTRERVYSIIEIAFKWGTSFSRVAKVFKNEPGVLPAKGHHALYITPRIPESVLERVNNRKAESLHPGGQTSGIPASSSATHAPPAPGVPERGAHQEPVKGLYSFNQIAGLWKISPNYALQLFRDEPDVLEIARPRFGRDKSSHLRFMMPRVPEAALQRVRARLTKRPSESKDHAQN